VSSDRVNSLPSRLELADLNFLFGFLHLSWIHLIVEISFFPENLNAKWIVDLSERSQKLLFVIDGICVEFECLHLFGFPHFVVQLIDLIFIEISLVQVRWFVCELIGIPLFFVCENLLQFTGRSYNSTRNQKLLNCVNSEIIDASHEVNKIVDLTNDFLGSFILDLKHRQLMILDKSARLTRHTNLFGMFCVELVEDGDDLFCGCWGPVIEA